MDKKSAISLNVRVKFHKEVPEQALVLHWAVSSDSPTHPLISLPESFLHVLFRILDPGPHVVEQSLKSPQALQAEVRTGFGFGSANARFSEGRK